MTFTSLGEIALLWVVAGAIYLVWKRWPAAALPRISQPPTPSIAPPSASIPPPPPDGAAPPTPVVPDIPPREARAAVLRDRRKRGLCAHCDKPAIGARSLIEAEHSWVDTLYVYLGATPPTRWKIKLHPSTAVYGQTHCHAHAAMARGQQERFLARLAVQQTDLTEKQRQEIDELDLYGLDETLEKHTAGLRAKNPAT